jgi:hypothetical protein
MEVASGRQGDNPEANHQRANGEDPVAGVAILGCEGRGFTGSENLAADADARQEGAEDESDPSHGFIVLPWRM